MLKIIDKTLLTSLAEQAQTLPRLRTNFNLHPQLDDSVQRMCNVLQPDTYVRPHRHAHADKWELFVAIVGKALVLTFDDAGKVLQRVELNSGGPTYGLEIPAGTWHTLACLETGTTLFEVKRGPYEKLTDKDFAPWAPVEGDTHCSKFVTWYKNALPGMNPPRLI